MCLIVLKEAKESKFTNRHFKAMITRNSQGLGVMYLNDKGRVEIDKSVGTPKQKFLLWQKHKHRDTYAMHARLTTHGLTNLDNCHPYKILSIDDGDGRDLYMMHNGVIRSAPETDKTMSDTWHFVQHILKPIVKNNIELLWDSDPFQQWLQEVIKGSKLLFMRSREKGISDNVLIINAADGKEVDGCWLSNTHSTTEHTTYRYSYVAPSNVYGGNASNKDPFIQPKSTTSYPITDIKESVVCDKDALYSLLNMLNTQPQHEIYSWVKETPEDASDILLAFDKSNKDTFEELMTKCKSNIDRSSIVDRIRYCASVECKQVRIG